MIWFKSYVSDLGLDIVMITLFSISVKFSTQCNKMLGYKLEFSMEGYQNFMEICSYWVNVKILCSVQILWLECYRKIKSGWEGLNFFPYCGNLFIASCTYYIYTEISHI